MPTSTPLPTPTASPIPVRVHVVAQGDTPSGIALQYGINVEALMQANPGLDPRRLQIGQELLIPAPGMGGEMVLPSEPRAESRVITHTVQERETLLGIAAKYGITLNGIYALNPGVSPQFLQVGQVLRLDLGPPTPTPTSTPLPTATPFPYPAPVLLWPREEEEFQGSEAHILLQWTSVGILQEDEWYEVQLFRGEKEIGTWRTKAQGWRIPSELYSGPGDSLPFRWDVVVKRSPPEGQPVSPLSVSRRFFWR